MTGIANLFVLKMMPHVVNVEWMPWIIGRNAILLVNLIDNNQFSKLCFDNSFDSS